MFLPVLGTLGLELGGKLGRSLLYRGFLFGSGKGVAIALHVVPVATGEVGHLDGLVAMVHGEGAQLGQTAPLAQVVHIYVERQAMLQTVDQTAVHNEIHTAVAAHFLGLGHVAGNERTLVLLGKGATVGHGHIGMARQIVGRGAHTRIFQLGARESVALSRILVGEALGTRKLVHAVVGLRGHHVVVYLDNLAVLGTDKRSGLVAVGKLGAGLARHLLGPRLAVHRLGVHGH